MQKICVKQLAESRVFKNWCKCPKCSLEHEQKEREQKEKGAEVPK